MRRQRRIDSTGLWSMVVVIVMALNPLGCRCDRKRQPVADQTLADVIVTKTSDAVTLTDLLAERERLARAVKKRQRAQQMIEVGDYEGALPLLRELEDTLPDDSVRLTLLAEALARARPLATSRLRTGPETPEALIYLHRLCLQEEAVACAALRKKPAVAALMKRVPEFEAVLDAHKKRLPRGRLDLALKSQRQVGSVLHEMFGAPVLDLVVGHFDGHKSPSVALRFARWPSVVYLATRRSKGWRLHYVSHTYGRGSYRIALRKLSVGVDRDLLWLRYTGYESEYDGNDVHVLIQAAPAPIVSACLFTTRYREDPSGGLNKRLPRRGAPGDVPIVGCVRGDWLGTPSSDTTGTLMMLPVETLQRPVLVIDLFKGGVFNAATTTAIRWESPRTVTYRFDGRRFRRAALEREVREQRYKLAVERLKLARKGGRRALALLLEARRLAPTDVQIQFELVRALQAASDKRLCGEIGRLLRLGGDRAKELVDGDPTLATACKGK